MFEKAKMNVGNKRKRCGDCKYQHCLGEIDGKEFWVCALTYEDLNRGRFMCKYGEE